MGSDSSILSRFKVKVFQRPQSLEQSFAMYFAFIVSGSASLSDSLKSFSSAMTSLYLSFRDLIHLEFREQKVCERKC